VTVTFDWQGGSSASPGSLTREKGTPLGDLPEPPTKDGFTFVGWNTHLDGSGAEGEHLLDWADD
jgi:hypothetical protein